MGYCVLHTPSGDLLFANDEHGLNQWRRDNGLPYYDRAGRFVDSREIERQEKNPTGA